MGDFLVECASRRSSVMSFPGDVSTKLLFIAAIMVITFAGVQLVFSSSSSSFSYSAVTYKIGDDVIEWSSSNRNFHVGDTIHFEYDPNYELYQHVVQVTPTAYQLCDVTSPIAVFTTGNDSITFNNTGHYYFIFGPAGTCVQEQMLDIYIQPEEDDEDHDDASVTPTLAPATVSLSSSSSTAVATASSEPTPSSDNSFDDFIIYIMLGFLVFLLMSES